MKRYFSLLLLLLMLSTQVWGQLRFTRYVALSHCSGELCWTAQPQAQSYILFRLMPSQSTFEQIATIADTHYVDTLHRVICSDTVRYFVQASCPDTLLWSDTVGIPIRDDVSTSPCSLRLCSVDSATSRILLSWYPSPDTDIMGYYICMGSPCLNFDTVWGRATTTYLCPDSLQLSPFEEHSFRILAFDSCLQASPLTHYYHNPVLQFDDPGCSRHLVCHWNRYVNMPDSVHHYTFNYRLDDSDSLHTLRCSAEGPFQFDTTIADLSVTGLTAWLEVHSPADTLVARSAPTSFTYPVPDSAAYLRIIQLQYVEEEPAVNLAIQVDTAFPSHHCYLYRCKGVGSTDYTRIADLDADTAEGGILRYHDRDISRAALRYCYRVGMPDACEQRQVYSDTAELLLPEVQDPGAYLPNVIIYQSESCGKFCPHLISPLDEGYDLTIYNRAGLLVFHTTDISQCWDGNTTAGETLPQGTYVYRIHCHHLDGSIQTYTGTILLLH